MNDFEEATLIASKTTYDATDCDKHPFPVLYIPSVGCAMCHIKELQLENERLRAENERLNGRINEVNSYRTNEQKAYEAAQRWIPVSERLPDDGVVVVVPLLFAEIQSAKLVNGKWCEAFGKQPILNAAGGLMEFEKWYPLPALEKADE